MSIIRWLAAHERPAVHVLLVFLAAMAVCYGWARLRPPQPVVFESQHQASTLAGVEGAANIAQVPLTASQASRVAQSIQVAPKTQPAASVVTTGAKAQATVQTELKKSGGQFAIVTDPVHPDSTPYAVPAGKPAPPNTETIPSTATVTLNQYNIKAYPDRLVQIGVSYHEVFTSYSWRVSVPKLPLFGAARCCRLPGRLCPHKHRSADQFPGWRSADDTAIILSSLGMPLILRGGRPFFFCS